MQSITELSEEYNLAMYLEIRRQIESEVLFHNLYEKERKICAGAAYRMDKLSPNHIIMADNLLLDEVYEM